MGDLRRNLAAGEHIICEATQRWIVLLLAPEGVLLFGILFAVMVGAQTGSWDSTSLIVGLSAFNSLLICAGTAVQRATARYTLTNKRIASREGLVGMYTREVLLSQVESVEVVRDVVGTTLGFGTLVMTDTGGAKHRFIGISQPTEFREHILNALESEHQAA